MPKYRYCHLKGDATITNSGDTTTILLHDRAVNPRGELLKFEAPLESDPGANPAPNGSTRKEINLVAAFDLAWFEDTINRGFLLTKEDGTPVTTFMDLEAPEAMDPIKP